jgi:hypothetical protein
MGRITKNKKAALAQLEKAKVYSIDEAAESGKEHHVHQV